MERCWLVDGWKSAAVHATTTAGGLVATANGDVFLNDARDAARQSRLAEPIASAGSPAEGLVSWARTEGVQVEAVIVATPADLPLLALGAPALVLRVGSVDLGLGHVLDGADRAALEHVGVELHPLLHPERASALARLADLPRLRHVEVGADVDGPLDLAALTQCQGLRSVYLHTRLADPLPALPALESLRLNCTYADTFTLDPLARLSALSSLEVKGPQAALAKGLAIKKLAKLPLRSVVLRDLRVKDVSALSAFIGLRELEFAGHAKKGAQVLDVSKLVDLRRLVAHDVEVVGLSSCAALEEVVLTTCTDASALAGAAGLRSLTIFDAVEGLDLSFVAGMPSLNHLDLGWSYAFQEAQLAALAGLPGLRIGREGQVHTLEALREQLG